MYFWYELAYDAHPGIHTLSSPHAFVASPHGFVASPHAVVATPHGDVAPSVGPIFFLHFFLINPFWKGRIRSMNSAQNYVSYKLLCFCLLKHPFNCNTLHCTALHCTALHNTALYTTLQLGLGWAKLSSWSGPFWSRLDHIMKKDKVVINN